MNRTAATALALCAIGLRGSMLPGAAYGDDAAVKSPPTGMERPLMVRDGAITATDVREFATVTNVSVSDAESAFADSKTIVDFIREHADDPQFGSIWVTYKGGYRVHLRKTSLEPLDSADTDLRKALRGPLDISAGGLSYEAIRTKFEQVRSALGDALPRANVVLDEERGVIRAKGSGTALLALATPSPDPHVELDFAEASPSPATYSPGSPIYYWFGSQTGWFAACSVGYNVRRNSDNWPGIVTAGHCPLASWSNPGRTGGRDLWPAENHNCGPTSDSQVHPMTQGATSTTTTNGLSIWQNAGGLYLNQPAHLQGMYTSAATSVHATGSFNTNGAAPGPNGQLSPLASCPFTFAISGFQLEPIVGGPVPGDSGAPVLLAYDGRWYLGGIMSGGQSQNYSNVTAIWNIPMPGWRMCVVAPISGPGC